MKESEVTRKIQHNIIGRHLVVAAATSQVALWKLERQRQRKQSSHEFNLRGED